MARLLLAVMGVVLCGCGPGLEFNASPEMTPEQMLGRASHVFIGVIEKQEFESQPYLRVPGENSKFWKVLRRRLRVETVLRGGERRPFVDFYEIYWTGGASGDWNSTQKDRRYLLLLRIENGRYHVVRDWRRSIFEVPSGRQSRLPLDDSRPFWERVALMMWWIQPDWSPSLGSGRDDPGGTLSMWRRLKIWRGMLRHPVQSVRLLGCENLVYFWEAQDECWDQIAKDERKLLNRHHNMIPPDESWQRNRDFERRAAWHFENTISTFRRNVEDADQLRAFTTINNPRLRAQFCREFEKRFPNDHDNGCPADRPPPATIVTEDGDVPLVGAWPAGQ